MSELLILLLFGVYILVIYILTKYSYSLFKKRDWVGQNYEGKFIVHSFGLQLFLHYIIYILLFVDLHFYIEKFSLPFEVYVFLFSLLIITVMGWLDDRYGIKQIKGLKGHFRAFFVDHKITSGFVKAIISTSVAIFFTYFFSVHFFEWIFHVLLMIFSIHIFNLFDVRPGRTIKSFWLFVLILFPFFPKQELLIYIIPFVVSTFVIFPYERKRLTMLGDAGSNVIGYVFGFYLILLAHTLIQFFFLSLFIVLSLLAEKYSFTEYIKKTPWLSKLDNWGIYTSIFTKD